MNDEFNIMQRQKLAKNMDVSEENAAEFITIIQMSQVTALKDIMERVTYQVNKMRYGMVSKGMPVSMARTLSDSLAMSAALSIIDTIAIKGDGDANELAKKLMKMIDSSSAVTIKLGGDDLENKV